MQLEYDTVHMHSCDRSSTIYPDWHLRLALRDEGSVISTSSKCILTVSFLGKLLQSRREQALNKNVMTEFQYTEEVEIPFGNISLTGDLIIPTGADSIILFAHGSGSSRHSSRNRFVARVLQDAGFATLLFDLLTRKEDEDYAKRFQIDLLTERLIGATSWIENRPEFDLNIGYFGASTGAAATLEAAARLGDVIGAVVSRGGRPDLAIFNLPLVKSPTSLIVGGLDHQVIELNQKAYKALDVEKELVIIEGATHLFEEPGTLEQVADHAAKWFRRHLKHVAV